MGVIQRVKTWVIEALGGSATGSVGYSNAEDTGWTPITQLAGGAKSYRRDLTPMSQAEMLKVAHYLYAGNALAQFLINVPVALTVGRSASFSLEYDHERLGITREQAQELAAQARRFLDPWWEHPAHDFKARAARYARTYLVTGELLLVIPEEGINPTTGLFMLDYIDSALIKDVHGKNGLATTPGRVDVASAGAEPTAFEVMLPTVDGTYQGECFFFRHVGRLNSLRGISDLVGQADWIDLHDQLLITRGDKALLANTLIHELVIKNAQPGSDTIKKEVDAFRAAAQKPGGAWGHNESIEHSIKAPDLKETDSAVLVRAILLYVLGSKGYPEHWFSEGGNASKANAGEQSEIAIKVLEELQEELLQIFTVPLTVAYDRLAAAQAIFPARDTGAVRLVVNLPKISERDISKVGGVIANVEAALGSAVEAGRISKRTALRVFLTLVEKLTGESVDVDDETERITIEKAEAESIEQERANAATKAAADLADQIDDDDSDEEDEGADPPRVAKGPRRTPPPPLPPNEAPKKDDEEGEGARGLSVNLNGAQIQAATAIIVAVVAGELPRDSGVNQLEVLFGLSRKDAERLIGTAGTKTPTTPNPVGGPGVKPRAEGNTA